MERKYDDDAAEGNSRGATETFIEDNAKKMMENTVAEAANGGGIKDEQYELLDHYLIQNAANG